MKPERKPPETIRERLRNEHWELLNSYGQGSHIDGAITLRIAEIERILSLPD